MDADKAMPIPIKRRLTWNDLSPAIARVTWRIPHDPRATPAETAETRAHHIDGMVFMSWLAACVRGYCSGRGHHLTCRATRCVREKRCATLRHEDMPGWDMFNGSAVPVCVPPESVDEVGATVRGFLFGTLLDDIDHRRPRRGRSGRH